MRKLASIRTISDIVPIEGADAIECVIVDGWKVVAKKGEFSKGDLCVYFEIDSVLPVREEFEFLRKGCYVKKDWLVSESNPTGEGFRLKTIKLRGQISQGLVIPIGFNQVEEGDDVTDVFGIVKWDPPVPATLAGRVRGNFPSFIPKTDQERIQNIKAKDLEKYADDDFEVTIKLDGSSMTVYSFNDKVGVCSRNLDLDWENDQETTFARVFIESGLKDFMTEHPGLAIQGELMGPGIQGNREKLKDHTFFVFDVYDIEAGQYMDSELRQKLIHRMQTLDGVKIEHCPHIGTIKAAQMTSEDLLLMAEGPSIVNSVREGLVFKSIQHPNFSFKAISNKFLLSGGE